METFKIYALKDRDVIRYIGQTKFNLDKRFKEHLRENKPCYKNSWIKSLLINGITPEIELIDECLTREEANEKEIHYIKLFKSFGAKLVNTTIGGVAPMKGKRHSEEHKEKLKELMKGSHNPFFGKKHSKETLKIMSENRKGKPSWSKGKTFTENHRKKLSEIRKQNFVSGKLKTHNDGKSTIDTDKVFDLHKNGFTQTEIARQINTDQGTISRILNNKYKSKLRKSVSKVSAS